MRPYTALLVTALLAVPVLAAAAQAQVAIERREVDMWIPAVGQRADGSLFGVASRLTVTLQSPGTGQVFLATRPHTQIDMQGSARLAVATAGAIGGVKVSDKDFFFSVDTQAITVGGPSAGGAMAIAVLALLRGWNVRDDVVMTGMIDPDGSIGPIGGILQKAEAADSVGANTFLIPLGQGTQSARNAQTGQVESVDVKAYARQRFGLEVVEVGDLFDVSEHATDHRLIRPQPTIDPLTNAAYADITSRLGSNLTETAADRLGNVAPRYEAEKAQIGQGDRQVIEEQLTLARGRIASARDAQNASHQYLASSLAFQAHVALAYVEALVTYHEGNSQDAGAYLGQYLAETQRLIDELSPRVRATYPMEASRLDAQAAAEQRVLEALELLDAAAQSRTQGRLLSSLQSASFARERAESARWWHQIGRDVAAAAAGPEVTRAGVLALISQHAETARLQLDYAALIAPNDPALLAAQASLEDAETARANDRLAGALFELVEVFAQTSTALVSVAGEGPVRQRLAVLEQAAAYQIELAQGEGAPPIYAISLLELAQSRADSDPVAAYSGFSAARIAARTSLQAAGIQAPAPDEERLPLRLFRGVDASLWVAAYFVTSAVVVLILAGRLLRSPPPRRAPRPTLDRPADAAPPPVIAPPPPAPTLLLPPPLDQPTQRPPKPRAKSAAPRKPSQRRKPGTSTRRRRKDADKP